MSSQFGNINNAFNQNQTLIERPDFTNRGGIIHNNMGDLLRDQKLVEYNVHINSKDRDTYINKSPFNFKIVFGESKSFKIDKKLLNVKYITLDYVILPKNVAIDVSRINFGIIYPTGSEITPGISPSSNNLTKLKSNYYLILKIEEIGSSRRMGTSPMIDSNTFILYHDKSMGLDGDLWRPIHGTIVYPSVQPLTLSQMSIKLYDFQENEIKIVDQNGNDIIKNNISGVGKNYLNYIKDNNDNDSVIYTNNVIQMLIMMTVGVVENELSISNC